MEIFKTKDFERLSDVHKPFCVSIYIPTHRISTPGQEMDEDRIELKNQLQDARDQLIIHGMKESEAEPYLEPISKLLDNNEFWNYQSDGLAIFYNGKEVETFHIPIEFKSYAYVSERYYLLPLAGMLHDSSTHFILELSLDHVKLYEATRYTIAEVGISHLVPTQLEDAVGYDYEQKQLGRRSNQGETGDAEGLYHGHGSGNETEKKKRHLNISDRSMKVL
ncbi:baeRF7 domain-containing protein [Mangrovivirga cuniculi]|uniref:Uncharacterized protein n=1 Tax=Mangrovivirga cuniculi TaxID=2715131 RepID=A0A4D7JWB5_9BACT|nr:hypothetical protein DCC35_19720 [Mangrovivirga cuniculi]